MYLTYSNKTFFTFKKNITFFAKRSKNIHSPKYRCRFGELSVHSKTLGNNILTDKMSRQAKQNQ